MWFCEGMLGRMGNTVSFLFYWKTLHCTFPRFLNPPPPLAMWVPLSQGLTHIRASVIRPERSEVSMALLFPFCVRSSPCLRAFFNCCLFTPFSNFSMIIPQLGMLGWSSNVQRQRRMGVVWNYGCETILSAVSPKPRLTTPGKWLPPPSVLPFLT